MQNRLLDLLGTVGRTDSTIHQTWTAENTTLYALVNRHIMNSDWRQNTNLTRVWSTLQRPRYCEDRTIEQCPLLFLHHSDTLQGMIGKGTTHEGTVPSAVFLYAEASNDAVVVTWRVCNLCVNANCGEDTEDASTSARTAALTDVQ